MGSMLIAYNGGSVYISLGNATAIPDSSTMPPGNSCSSGTAKLFTLSGGMTCVDTHYGNECAGLRR